MDEKTKKKAGMLLKALDDAIANGSWDETNFILIIGKKLRFMRDMLAEDLKESGETSVTSAFLARQMAMQSTLKQVFIGLYSLEGTSLQAWERIIANLRRQ